MPRVKKSLDTSASSDVHSKLPTIQTMRFVDGNDALRHMEEQREAFDAASLLEDMFQPSPPHLVSDMKALEEEDEEDGRRQCPLCETELQYDEVDTKKGDTWCYYRCPSVKEYTKCFVSCGQDDIDRYLPLVQNQLHQLFRGTPESFITSHMRCYCQMSLILALSKSTRNKDRLYFKCPKGMCCFFQWADEAPTGKVDRWLREGVNTKSKGKENRHRPYDLARPISTPRPFEATLRR